MRRFIESILALAALCLGVAAPAAATSCSDQLQQELIAARTADAEARTSDFELYFGLYQCLGRSAAEANGLAALRVQLAQAGEEYVADRLTPAAYRAYLLDRQRKAELMRDSAAYAIDVGRGDADGDLIPDSADICPQTETFVATDDKGCDSSCPPVDRDSSSVDPFCLIALLSNNDEDPLRPLVDALVPINLSCEDVTPAASTPITWGIRETSVFSGQAPPFATIDSMSGYYFSVRRTSQQADDCEIWYALQFAFRKPQFPGLAANDVVSVLFSSAEDENPSDPEIVRFALITNQSQVEGDILRFSTDLPLSDGRMRLRDDLFDYSEVSIRVRVITGAQQASPWSAFVAKTAGVAISD